MPGDCDQLGTLGALHSSAAWPQLHGTRLGLGARGVPEEGEWQSPVLAPPPSQASGVCCGWAVRLVEASVVGVGRTAAFLRCRLVRTAGQQGDRGLAHGTRRGLGGRGVPEE